MDSWMRAISDPVQAANSSLRFTSVTGTLAASRRPTRPARGAAPCRALEPEGIDGSQDRQARYVRGLRQAHQAGGRRGHRSGSAHAYPVLREGDAQELTVTLLEESPAR